MSGAGGTEAAQARRAPLRRPLRVKMISPAKTAPDSRFWRSIKYSLFPPLGLATLAGYLDPDDEIDLQDEHVETLDLDDEPDLVVIEAYITSARRAYRYADHYRARGAYVCLGGLHPTSLPEEAAQHADSVFCGPGEDTWPAFLRDFRAGHPQPLYRSTERTLDGLPPARRDLIKRERYLVPELAGGQPRLPAHLRLLLQGGVLPRRPVVLRAGGRRCPGGDRPPPRPAPLLPRRQPVRQPAVRRGAVRRAPGRRPRVAGGRDGGGGAASRPAREGRGERAAQPVHRLRDAERGEPGGRRQDAEPGRRLAARSSTTPPSGACTTSA